MFTSVEQSKSAVGTELRAEQRETTRQRESQLVFRLLQPPLWLLPLPSFYHQWSGEGDGGEKMVLRCTRYLLLPVHCDPFTAATVLPP